MGPGIVDPERTRRFPRLFLSRYADRNDRAEFMLDVIGAGATATSTIDWHAVWQKSPEATATAYEIQEIHKEGRNRPAVETKQHTEYSTSWVHQTSVVVRRGLAAIWRDPVYVTARLAANTIGPLFLGFTFWKTPSTEQGVQNKLFSIFVVLILTVPASQQVQTPFIADRTTYEIRERPSKMYSWSVWVTARILVELPWSVLSGMPMFFCWYWTVGFPTERAGFTFLVVTILMPLYAMTVGLGTAAVAPTAEIAALVFISMFSLALML